MAKALALLARREHSAAELRRKLLERGLAEGEVDAALATLAACRWQSDGRFAESLVRRRLESGYGPRLIEAELARHGIDRDAAAALLAGEDWNQRALAALGRRAARGPGDPAGLRRLAAFLERRGYPAAAIRAALASLGRASGVEAD